MNQVIKSPKLLSQQIRTRYYQTLKTSVINSPSSPLSLIKITHLDVVVDGGLADVLPELRLVNVPRFDSNSDERADLGRNSMLRTLAASVTIDAAAVVAAPLLRALCTLRTLCSTLTTLIQSTLCSKLLQLLLSIVELLLLPTVLTPMLARSAEVLAVLRLVDSAAAVVLVP